MKLHRLAFTAIGPFPGTEVIDFTAFDDSGLFLLEGPTGAGKSTIIDAITFALYGDVARLKDSSKDRLRSDLAAPSVQSEVDLVFEVSSGIYRVRRFPSYIPKNRKNPRNVPATLVSVLQDPSAEDGFRTRDALASGARQVDPTIRGLIGLSKEQFLQTVVLPQGKFAEFLTASSKERESILSDIFDTRVYTELQRDLVAAGSEVKTRVAEAESSCLNAFRHVISQAELTECEDSTPDAELALASDGATSRDFASRVVHVVQERTSVAKQQVFQAQDHFDKASAALNAAQNRNKLIAQRKEYEEKQEELARRTPAVNAARDELSRAQTVAPIVPLLKAEERARERLERARTALDTAIHAVHPLVPELVFPQEGADSAWEESARQTLQSAIKRTTEHRSKIRQLLDLEAGLKTRREEAERLAKSVKQYQAKQKSIDDQLHSIPQKIKELENTEKNLRKERAQLEGASERVHTLTPRLKAAQSLPDLHKRVEECRKNSDAAQLASEEAAKRARSAYQDWLQQTGAALADTLTDNSACPVCGSTDHPHPAAPIDTEHPVTRQTLRDLDAARERADKELQEANRRENEARNAVVSAADRAGASVEELISLMKTAQQEVARMETIDCSLDQVGKDLARHRSDLEELRSKESKVKQRFTEENTRLDLLRQSIKADSDRCAAALQGSSSLQDLDTELSEILTQLENTSASLDEWSRSVEADANATAETARLLRELNIADSAQGRADVKSRLRTAQRLHELETLICDFDTESGAIRQALHSQSLKDLHNAESVDIQPLEDALAQANEQLNRANIDLGKLIEAQKSAQKAQKDFLKARSELENTRAQAGPIQRLAGIADASSKENLMATPLSSWVLISRLDEVLQAANPRLLAISAGRYELVSTPDDGTSARRLGLGLKILDHETEEERATRTLSGGETFYTSLALALGLADVVTSQAGGIELRTMFIDEGFGSLDSATLDLVMHQLHALRASGRTVGVISHVDEMARQIPDQIRVFRKAEGGSRLRLRI